MTRYTVKSYRARCQWLKPVILATWEAEMERTVVGSNVGQQIVHETPIFNTATKKKKGLKVWLQQYSTPTLQF
jgi:hypothetical protein